MKLERLHPLAHLECEIFHEDKRQNKQNETRRVKSWSPMFFFIDLRSPENDDWCFFCHLSTSKHTKINWKVGLGGTAYEKKEKWSSQNNINVGLDDERTNLSRSLSIRRTIRSSFLFSLVKLSMNEFVFWEKWIKHVTHISFLWTFPDESQKTIKKTMMRFQPNYYFLF